MERDLYVTPAAGRRTRRLGRGLHGRLDRRKAIKYVVGKSLPNNGKTRLYEAVEKLLILYIS